MNDAASRSATAGLVIAVLTAGALGAGCRQVSPPPDPANELPFGVVDTPRNGELVGRTVDVAGWAMDDSAIAVVHVYVDAKYQTSAPLTLPRPDVSKANQTYVRADSKTPDVHGWQAWVDLGENPGPHTIRAQAVDDRGATRDLGAVTVTLIGR